MAISKYEFYLRKEILVIDIPLIAVTVIVCEWWIRHKKSAANAKSKIEPP
jgi:hypothetical protein